MEATAASGISAILLLLILILGIPALVFGIIMIVKAVNRK